MSRDVERVRPADGQASILIDAPAEGVWSLVTDITRSGEWSPESRGGTWLDGATGPTLGARFKGSNRRGRTKWTTTCEVIASDYPRVFSFATGSVAKPNTTWRFVLEPLGESTRLTQSFELTKPLGFTSRLVTRLTTGVRDRRADLEENVRSSVVRIKEIAEA